MGIDSWPKLKKDDGGAVSKKLEEQQRQLELKRKREINEFLGNKWLHIGRGLMGVQAEWSGQKRQIEAGPGKPKTWNRNGDTLAATGLDGALFVTPYAESVHKKLESMGFEKDESLGVPMSHGEKPITSDFKEGWERLQTLARMERAAAEREQKEAA